MSDFGTPPVIPADLQQYNSYVTDPHYARIFSTIWPSALGVFVLLALPGVVRSSARAVRLGRGHVLDAIRSRVFGVREEWGVGGDDEFEARAGQKEDRDAMAPRRRSGGVLGRVEEVAGRAGAMFYWTLPGLGLNAGQILLIAAYMLAVLMCIIMQAPLVSNSNRAGFLALAQLPPLFLLATKNSPLALLLSSSSSAPFSFSYTHLNFMHRWSGRLLFLAALLHGSLWIRNHLQYGIPIIGAQKEESGVAALGVLGMIAVSSVRGVRRAWWEVFWVIHLLAFPAFFITICYHTIYAAPWIFPPLAFYGLDLVLRMLKHRTLDAVLVPVNKQMTLVHIPHVTTGWRAGQHVRLRIYAPTGGARIFESHPLSICTAPPSVTCVRAESMPVLRPVWSEFDESEGFGGANEDVVHVEEGGDVCEKPAKKKEQAGRGEDGDEWRVPRGMSLGIRAVGDWSNAVNAYAREAGEASVALSSPSNSASKPDARATSKSKSPVPVPVPVQVTLDGPYGGCSLDLGEYETVLLFAGGSGATFTLGLLDDIVGRVVRLSRRGGEVTRRVEFSWCVRSFGSIDWFAPALADIALAAAACPSLDLHISIYVTCLCNPEAVPPIPNCEVTIVRPSVGRVLRELTRPRRSTKKGTRVDKTDVKTKAAADGARAPRASSEESDDEAEEDIEEVDAEDEDEEAAAGVPRLPSLPASESGGGLAVCASGPESLVREAANAVARLQMPGRARADWVGRVGLHTEVFMV